MNLYLMKDELDQGRVRPFPLKELYQSFARSPAAAVAEVYQLEKRGLHFDYQPPGGRWIVARTLEGRDTRGYSEEWEDWAGPFPLEEARAEQAQLQQRTGNYAHRGEGMVVALTWYFVEYHQPLRSWLDRELGNGPWSSNA